MQHVTHGNNYIHTVKEPGCKAKSTVTREYEITIPGEDPERQQYNETCADELPMLKAFSCSMQGNLFSVEYSLRVFVKHDSWNEFGQGNCINLPIQVIQPPIDITSDDVIQQKPENWNPHVAETVQMVLPEMNPTDPQAPGHVYYKDVLAPAQEKWKKKESQRITMTVGEPEEEKFED